MRRILAFTFFALLSMLCLVAAGRAWTGQVLGDPVRGGRIYDNWVSMTGRTVPETSHPLWDTQDSNRRTGAVTWLCTECHGWDYKGADGAYGMFSNHYTGFTGIMGMVGASQQDVLVWFNGTANTAHDFSSYFDATDVMDLVAFLRTRQIDTNLMIDQFTGRSLGDPQRGVDLYEGTCAECHGEDGARINFGTEDEPLFLADMTVVDPWRSVHKIRFGTPVSRLMPATEELGWSLGRVADVLAYAQTLQRANPSLRPFSAVATGPVLESQGRVAPLVWASVVLLLIVLAGAGYDYYQQRSLAARRPANGKPNRKH
ncbi:MAG: cytochrome c [Anaerolineales bacterium]|nr:MAG: cytochrome c [Anaerolineales bacterium]